MLLGHGPDRGGPPTSNFAGCARRIRVFGTRWRLQARRHRRRAVRPIPAARPASSTRTTACPLGLVVVAGLVFPRAVSRAHPHFARIRGKTARAGDALLSSSRADGAVPGQCSTSHPRSGVNARGDSTLEARPPARGGRPRRRDVEDERPLVGAPPRRHQAPSMWIHHGRGSSSSASGEGRRLGE